MLLLESFFHTYHTYRHRARHIRITLWYLYIFRPMAPKESKEYAKVTPWNHVGNQFLPYS
jgi:hypothetical protein